MKAIIHLADGVLVATLENGMRLAHEDAQHLGDLLWVNQVTFTEVTMLNWHEDSERSPLVGQKIALLQRLRLHEQSLSDRADGSCDMPAGAGINSG